MSEKSHYFQKSNSDLWIHDNEVVRVSKMFLEEHNPSLPLSLPPFSIPLSLSRLPLSPSLSLSLLSFPPSLFLLWQSPVLRWIPLQGQDNHSTAWIETMIPHEILMPVIVRKECFLKGRSTNGVESHHFFFCVLLTGRMSAQVHRVLLI